MTKVNSYVVIQTLIFPFDCPGRNRFEEGALVKVGRVFDGSLSEAGPFGKTGNSIRRQSEAKCF